MTLFDQALADSICDEISKGKSLASVCRDMTVDYTSVFRWLRENEAFAQDYTRAREAQADYFADEIIEIVDTIFDPALARVRMDARKWVAGKMRPKKYGDRVDLTHQGVEGGTPIATSLTVEFVKPA